MLASEVCHAMDQDTSVSVMADDTNASSLKSEVIELVCKTFIICSGPAGKTNSSKFLTQSIPPTEQLRHYNYCPLSLSNIL